MENSRDDAAMRPPAGLGGDSAARGADTPGLDPPAAQASRKPRIEVLRAEPTGVSGPRATDAARYPRPESMEGAGQGAAYAPASMLSRRRRSLGRPGRRRGWWLLLLAAMLLLILVAALSYVAFSPGGDHTISERKTSRRSTSTENSGEVAAKPAADEATDTAARTAASTESPDEGVPSGATPALAPAAVPHSEDVRIIERSRAERPPSDAALRNLPAAPEARDATAAESETPTDDEDLLPVEDESALRTAREFYAALSAGDGAAAAQYVIPSKRQSGPLSAGELTRYYSNLRRPMMLRRATPIGGDAVRVAYEYVLLDGRLCQGQATVNVTQDFDRPLISSIRTRGPC